MTTKSGFNALPSNQNLCWPGTDETGSTERHAACGFSIMLERCMHGDIERGSHGVRVRARGRRGPVFISLQIRSRDEYLRGPTEEDQDERGITQPSSGSSIASLLL